jgi:hypothetical protein
MLASPSNPIFEEVQHIYNYVDPINFSSEFSRELVYQNLNLLRTLTLKSALDKIGVSPNSLSPLIFGASESTQNSDLLKYQYRPMKKGVTNMVKLHATGAIAMPIEIRLHILASSKDVIHS